MSPASSIVAKPQLCLLHKDLPIPDQVKSFQSIQIGLLTAYQATINRVDVDWLSIYGNLVDATGDVDCSSCGSRLLATAIDGSYCQCMIST